jgi:hypothetical protein
MLYLSIMKKRIIYLLIVLFVGLVFKNLYYDVYDSEVISVNSNLKYHAITFKQGKTSFEVTKNKENYDFYVNSNFFTKKKDVIGGLVIDGKKENPQLNKGGSFVVKNGKPYIVFNKVKKCDYLSQSIVWVIKNNDVNNRMLSQRHANKKVMRLLMGKNSNGDIVLIHSNPLVLVTMSDIVEYAKSQGVVDGIILDSGSSVDLNVGTKDYSHSIKALPSFIKRKINIHEPVVYIAGNFN